MTRRSTALRSTTSDMTTTDPHPTSEDRALIDMAAATLLEVDQRQFEEAFELLVQFPISPIRSIGRVSAKSLTEAPRKMRIAVNSQRCRCRDLVAPGFIDLQWMLQAGCGI